MKRRTLDIIVGLGLIVLAGLLLVAGVVLTSNANFANDYVKDQLGQQQISFKPAATLTAQERQSACLVTYAGQRLTTGKQAECYANEFIGLHLQSIAGGKTYAQLGDVQTELKAKIAALPKDDPAVAELQKQLTDTNAARETVFKGETLRGLLLTSYGFSEFGVKAGQAALVAYGAAGLLVLLGAAGLVHAAATPGSKGFAVPDTAKELVDA
ncbi:hypothetical protein Daura_17965 [Dactylosporangium aurantiacum]|uniref:Uncharacterized protein n=1 Tax=Dactylosporangium aurantiacum TaxID=35754 RepID=A0A9Q9ILQ8_9ACTN|nr:hypothetical protein [Dactylosporangium aurantiacum]UWZ50929.1 hypothetical protein Daura_29495 [Dactylosporangium aurantiacum]UWZ57886.1 hypothetical protein Daura_17965 [Dactylosporangium aurantiacum]